MSNKNKLNASEYFSAKLLEKLEEVGILKTSHLTSMTSEEFKKKGLHHWTNSGVARGMIDCGVYFSDGEEATKALVIPKKNEKQEIMPRKDSVSKRQPLKRTGSNGHELAQLAASSLSGIFNQCLNSGTAEVNKVETSVDFSVNDHGYNLKVALSPILSES